MVDRIALDEAETERFIAAKNQDAVFKNAVLEAGRRAVHDPDVDIEADRPSQIDGETEGIVEGVQVRSFSGLPKNRHVDVPERSAVEERPEDIRENNSRFGRRVES